MPVVYTSIKYIHILLAITAVGANITYGVWLRRAAREPEHLQYTLKGIKFLDDYIANPCYVLLLVSGLAMTFVAGIPLNTFWIAAAILLWFVAVIVGFALYTPTLRKQRKTLAEQGAESSEYKALNRRGTFLGIAVAFIVLVILFLMVFKPTPFTM